MSREKGVLDAQQCLPPRDTRSDSSEVYWDQILPASWFEDPEAKEQQ